MKPRKQLPEQRRITQNVKEVEIKFRYYLDQFGDKKLQPKFSGRIEIDSNRPAFILKTY